MTDVNPHRPRGTARSAALRAAIAYRDLARKDVASHMNVSVETVSRWQAGTATPDRDQRERLAALCQVPPGFIERGFEGLTERSTTLTEADIRDLIQIELGTATRRDADEPGGALPESDGQAG